MTKSVDDARRDRGAVKLPAAGRLRLERNAAFGPAYAWQVATWKGKAFPITSTDHRTVRELLTPHGGELLETPIGIFYGDGTNVTLAEIIERMSPATRPQPEPLPLTTETREVWSGDGPVRVTLTNRGALAVYVTVLHPGAGMTPTDVPHYFRYQDGLEPGQVLSDVITPKAGRKLLARASMSGAVTILCEAVAPFEVDARGGEVESMRLDGKTYDLTALDDADDARELQDVLDHNDRAGFDVIYTGSGAASDRLRRVVVERTGARFAKRSLGVTVDDCRQAVIAELVKGGAWVQAIDTAPDAAAPLSPRDGGALHSDLNAADDHTADVIDAANTLNANVRAARAAGLRVSVMISGTDLGDTDSREVMVAVQKPEPPAVDPDLIAAREIWANAESSGSSGRALDSLARQKIMAGSADKGMAFKAVLAAIKRGRELAR